MSDYVGRDIRFRASPLDLWEYGTVVAELPSPISAITDRLVVALDQSTVQAGVMIVAQTAIVTLHLVQLEVRDPMAPDYDALAAPEPTSQIQDARAAAETGG